MPVPMPAIINLHTEVVRMIRASKHYGGFDAVRCLASICATEILAENGFVNSCPLPIPFGPSTVSSCNLDDLSDNDDDTDGIAAAATVARTSGKAFKHN